MKLTPGSVNFGNQKVGTKSSPFPIKLINEGSSSLSISQIKFTGTNSGDFSQTNNCGRMHGIHPRRVRGPAAEGHQQGLRRA